MNATIKALWEAVGTGDATAKLALADALEEAGDTSGAERQRAEAANNLPVVKVVRGPLSVVQGPAQLVDIRDIGKQPRDRLPPAQVRENDFAVVVTLPPCRTFCAGAYKIHPGGTYLWLPSLQRSRESAQGWVDQIKEVSVDLS